ncbi:MMPL family transporter [Tessaracoccus rhinocerotis]|uniref:MMPL family transporter n=1 Tax=Tessaracoccus rhinocerotis TaxID=1689449 RepID=A0A553JWU9_9ACTN|nr:MMPL family transporter [Tessaracoccus rhinocerotis]TRY16939.1 MMPL family transporter [Tessaracoccus rhinocerotis]
MTGAPAPAEGEARRGFMGTLWYGYARVTVALRWFIVVGWVAAAVAATLFLPPMQGTVDDIEALGANDASFEAERRSLELFEFPLLARAAIVQRNPDGLPPLVQAEAVMRGIAVNQGKYETELLGAIPVPNTEGGFPGAAEKNTTVITYVFANPELNFFEQTRAVEDFAAEQLTDASDAYVGVTGSIPARAAQGLVLNSYVHIVEVTTVLAVLTIVALTFGSLAAPAVTLVSVGAAVFVTLGVSGWAGQRMNVAIPADLRPLIVALLLGIVTDYCIFYLSGLRTRLREGHDRLEAARLATASYTPIVTVAGFTVAAGTASLLVAESPLFRGFGPALALTVLTGLVVAVTLVPALLAILGRAAFWPRNLVAEPAKVRERPSLLTRAVARRGSAFVLVLVCVVGLGAAAYQARNLDLGLGFVQSLPETTSAQRAADAAGKGFAPGIVSPTEIVLEAPGIGEKTDEIAQFGEALRAQPGVAGLVGPGELRAADDVGAFTAESGDAVRFLVVLDSTPLESTAIDTLGRVEAALPQLAADANLGEVTTLVAGDTALASGIIADTSNDLLRIGLVALAVNLLLLVIFLRALVAPLYLLASSVLALGATLGLSVLFFQDFLGHDGLTFYVPFAASVLLLSLGSDYNIFAVGHVWQEARNRSMRDALLVATPESTRAITSAGLALAASFGLLAVIPLGPFHELGFLLGVGILIDVFIVRALLVPSLITLVGPVSSWPSGRLQRVRRPRGGRARADS